MLRQTEKYFDTEESPFYQLPEELRQTGQAGLHLKFDDRGEQTAMDLPKADLP